MLKRTVRFACGMFVVLSTVLVNASRAQDPLQVGPGIYKLLMENDRVRVLDVQFKPGQKVGPHSHPDHVAYVLAASKMRITPADGTPQELDPKVGDVLWLPAQIHSGENIGTSDLHIVIVELKEPAAKKSATPGVAPPKAPKEEKKMGEAP